MTTDRPDAPEPEDPVLEARIQHALLPYAHRLTPKALAEARKALTLVLTTHPVAVRLMDRLRERRAPGGSGVKPASANEAATAEPGHDEAASGDGKNKKGRGAR